MVEVWIELRIIHEPTAAAIAHGLDKKTFLMRGFALPQNKHKAGGTWWLEIGAMFQLVAHCRAVQGPSRLQRCREAWTSGVCLDTLDEDDA
jgi:hypothetical protein